MATSDPSNAQKRPDDPDRAADVSPARGGAVALADEGDVAFGGMAGIAILSAILVSMLALSGWFAQQADAGHTAEVATTMVDDDHADEDDHEGEDEAAAVVTTEAEATTTTEAETTTTTEAETTTTEAAATGADALVVAAPGGITLSGTVPDQATADSLHAAALASGYTEDQIDDTIEVVDGATPYTLDIQGTLSSEELKNRLSTEFAASAEATTLADGSTGVFTDSLEIVAGSDLETQLNELMAASPILFESGTDVITPDTIGVVDQAAELILADPEGIVEVGGHTDSRGDDGNNLDLSQRRADRVVEALVERGVAIDRLTSKGYGETLLKIDPDDTAEAQQQNRRIEFRIVG